VPSFDCGALQSTIIVRNVRLRFRPMQGLDPRIASHKEPQPDVSSVAPIGTAAPVTFSHCLTIRTAIRCV